MNAVVMDNAVVGESAIVAACAFVKAGMEIPARTLAAGVPAKVMRELSEQEMAWKAEGTRTYQNLTRRCLATMVATAPLAAPEAERSRIVMPKMLPLSETKAGAPR
jgi:phenylacetic acid degradation protein